jgi:hypothetical protein
LLWDNRKGAKTVGERGERLELGGREQQAKRMMRPAGCRAYMRKELAEKFPEIVEGFVEAAKTGSVAHVKLATELLKPSRKGTTRKKGSATRLLEKLERVDAAKRRAEAARGAGGTGQGER